MSVLGSILRPARTLVALATAAGVVSGVSGVALIALLRSAIVDRTTALDPSRVAAAFAGLCLLAAATRLVAQASTIRLAHGAASTLAVRVCRQALQLPLERFEGVDHARLLAVLTEDIGVLANALAGFPLACLNASVIVVCLGYVAWLSPVILGWAGAFAAVAGLTHHLTTGHGVGRLRAARGRQDALVAHYRTLIGGFRELKQHRPRREAFLAEALVAEAEAVRGGMVGGLTSFALAAAWGQLAFFGFIGFVVFALPRLAAVPAEALAGAVLVLLYILVPLDVLLVWGSSLARARASLGRIEALMPALGGAEVAPAVPEPEVDAPPFLDSIRLEGVEYAYGTGFAVGPVDLAIHAGEVVFIAGGNGSGKTTLMKLIAGLYEPEAGRITLDGRPITPAGREAYRQLFSVVFADGHLFREVRGVDGADLVGRSNDLLIRLGLDGVVGFDGAAFSTVDLSQGQRRRLALLAACLEARPVCLFDEWAANQDPGFKRVFYREILPELRAEGRTLVVISHDDEYLDVADRVVRLRDGRVAADAIARPGLMPRIADQNQELQIADCK